MKVTFKIVETYTKYEEVEIEDTGKLDEAYEDVDEMVKTNKILLPSIDKKSEYNLSIKLV